MPTRKSGSFQLRFVVLMTLIISTLSVLFYFYSIHRFESQAKINFNKRLQVIKGYLITGAESLFAPGIPGQIFDSTLTRASLNKDLVYVVVTDREGNILKSYQPEKASENNYKQGSESGELVYENEIGVNLIVPVINKEKLLGNLYFGVSREQMNSSIKKAQIDYGIAGGAVIILGFLLTFWAGYVIKSPFKKILKSTDEILKGDYTRRIKIKNKGEFTSIANTFNAFADRLEETNAQVLKLNDQIKSSFRNKLGELNLEINQRRLAEDSLRKSEEQFRLLFDIAPIGMVITSTDRNILKVNAAFERTLGYNESELVNLTTTELTYYEDRPADEIIYNDFLKGSIQNKNYEKRYVTKTGDKIDVVNRIILHNDENGKPVQFIEQVIDITEQKKLQRDLIDAKEKAEESDQMKSAFLAQMSHEIRTPLNVILAASGIFEEELIEHLDEDSREIVESVKSAGKRLMRTIDLILNMSAIQTGKYKPDFEEIDLNVEVKRLTEEFRTMSLEKQLKLSFTSHVDSGIVKADKYTVQQIFQNLISNAVKYTKQGSVEVVVFKTDRVCVEVKDTGIGMSKKYQEELFHPFSQEDVGLRREFEGNGLGLALVKKYIEINNADIKVESEKGRGTTFTVIF